MGRDRAWAEVVPLRWLVDERMHAAIDIAVPKYKARMQVSITALDIGPRTVCSIAVSYVRGERSLGYTAGLVIAEPDVDEPDLATFLTEHVRGAEFQRRVLRGFVARLVSCGML